MASHASSSGAMLAHTRTHASCIITVVLHSLEDRLAELLVAKQSFEVRPPKVEEEVKALQKEQQRQRHTRMCVCVRRSAESLLCIPVSTVQRPGSTVAGANT